MTPLDSTGPKIGGRCKQCAIIFYGDRVISNFVPKFVVMATGVSRGKILMTPSNWLTPKTIPYNQKLRLYLIHSRSYDSLKHCLIFPIGAIVISPPENDSFRKDFCFRHDFFSEREISELREPTGLKFCMMVSTRPNFIMPVQNFLGGRTPKKFQGPKTCKIWPDFGRLRSSAANISGTDEDI